MIHNDPHLSKFHGKKLGENELPTKTSSKNYFMQTILPNNNSHEACE